MRELYRQDMIEVEIRLREMEQYVELLQAFSDEIEAARNMCEDAEDAARELMDSTEGQPRSQKQLHGNLGLDIVYAVGRYKEADVRDGNNWPKKVHKMHKSLNPSVHVRNMKHSQIPLDA
jgi:hypothetical protein